MIPHAARMGWRALSRRETPWRYKPGELLQNSLTGGVAGGISGGLFHRGTEDTVGLSAAGGAASGALMPWIWRAAGNPYRNLRPFPFSRMWRDFGWVKLRRLRSPEAVAGRRTIGTLAASLPAIGTNRLTKEWADDQYYRDHDVREVL